MTTHWCPSCMNVCPGLDGAGYCLRADREEIDARVPGRVARPVLRYFGGKFLLASRGNNFGGMKRRTHARRLRRPPGNEGAP